MTDKPTRRALMRPVQLLAVAFGSAVFALLVGAMSMGAFTSQPPEVIAQAWTVAAIIAGIVFIVVLLILAMLLLVVDPADVTRTIDHAVLLPSDDETEGDAESGSAK
ncbi:amino acid transporter [Microbacterium betulae]|uniref:Amino acid transporter n=1 Tax=Microbacterium betulae TaxID=2981139 RepID=A0AA97FHV0_9MICO|nr:amino acid transporter [Microbacterium sp. AB]WOF22968.1 amino acid transporter [Microbacterium sp. AB]